MGVFFFFILIFQLDDVWLCFDSKREETKRSVEVLNALPRRLCIIYSPPRVINHGLWVSLLPIYDRIANALRAAVSLWESRQRWREEPSPVQLRHGGGGGDGEDEDNEALHLYVDRSVPRTSSKSIRYAHWLVARNEFNWKNAQRAYFGITWACYVGGWLLWLNRSIFARPNMCIKRIMQSSQWEGTWQSERSRNCYSGHTACYNKM